MTRKVKSMVMLVVGGVGGRWRVIVSTVLPDWRVSILLIFLTPKLVSLGVLYLIEEGAIEAELPQSNVIEQQNARTSRSPHCCERTTADHRKRFMSW